MFFTISCELSYRQSAELLSSSHAAFSSRRSSRDVDDNHDDDASGQLSAKALLKIVEGSDVFHVKALEETNLTAGRLIGGAPT